MFCHTQFWGGFAEGAHRVVAGFVGGVFVVELPTKEPSATATFLSSDIVSRARFVIDDVKFALDGVAQFGTHNLLGSGLFGSGKASLNLDSMVLTVASATDQHKSLPKGS